MSNTARAALGFALVASLAACGGGAPGGSAAREARARELFARHCTLCHGPHGLGDGAAAAYLHPPARDFSLGAFRLVSAPGGPTTDDLVATLRRGMPGSAMPGFAWLPDADLEALAALVQELSIDGIVRRAMEGHEPLDEAAALDLAARRLTPGTPLPHFALGEVDSELRARGATLFRSYCATCHGLDGRGRGLSFARHEDGSLALARDFTAGILKGGGAPEDIARRISCGLPGSSMPAFTLARDDLRALVAHVTGLLPEGAAERFRQVRRTIDARRVALEPTDEDWARAAEVPLHTSPLAWQAGAVLEAHVSALHDGRRVYVRVRWLDPTRDDEPLGGGPAADALAVQFSDDEEPALFGMGAAQHPVELWYWTAVRQAAVTGALDPLTVHGTRGDSDLPLLVDAGPAGGAEGFVGRGVGALEPQESDPASRAAWRDGEWSVVFSRPLAGRGVTFVPGGRVWFGVAVWNGAAGELGARKSVTIWHALALAE